MWSTNPLERYDKEGKRRSDVVGIFPNPAALLRLATCVLIESDYEGQVAERRYLSEESMAQLTPPAPTAITTTATKPQAGGDRHRHDPHGIVRSRCTNRKATRGTSCTTTRDFIDTSRRIDLIKRGQISMNV